MAESRSRKLSFSSEAASVPRWFGNEILDHRPEAVRPIFLNSGRAPLLVNHDTGAQPIGVVEANSVKFGADKIGRASVRFGRTAAAQDALMNVDDGIFVNTSVGYKVHEMRYESTANDEDTYKVVDWEPYEVSLVGVPADRSVGIGRGIEGAANSPNVRNEAMSEQNADAAGSKAATGGNGANAAAASRQAAIDEMNEAARKAQEGQTRVEVTRHETLQVDAAEYERRRVKGITTMCETCKIDDRLRRMWITGGTDIEKVADDIQEIVRSRGEVKPQSAAQIGLTSEEAERFSVVRAILACESGDWKHAGFEAECSRAVAQKLQRPLDPKRFYMPFEVQQRSVSQRAVAMHAQSGMYGARANSLVRSDMTRADVVGTTTAGGFLVETINLSFIELLRNRTVAFRLGATSLAGLVGNVNIPKQSGAATAMWLSSETTQITEAEQTFGQLAFSPHTIGGYTEISRLLLLQSSPDIEGIVNADLAAIIGIGVDLAALNGSGSAGQPKGIIGTSGVGTTTGTSLALAGLITAQTTVGSANVVPVRGGWASTFTVSGLLRQRQEFSNTYSPLWYGSVWEGVVLGFPGLASNQVPSGDLLFGDWAQLVVAQWGVLEVEVNPYANFQAGIIGVRAMMTVDIGLRYPGAFYVITSVT